MNAPSRSWTLPNPSFSRFVISGFDGVDINSQRLGKDGGTLVGKPHLRTFQGTYGGRTDVRGKPQLGLRQTRKNAKIRQTASTLRHIHKVGDAAFQRFDDLSERVDLRCPAPFFPIGDGRHADIRKSSKVSAGHSQIFPALLESVRDEVTQDSPAHALPSSTVGHSSNLASGSHNARISCAVAMRLFTARV